MAYWFDGPLAFGLAGKLGRQEMLAFAQAARQSMTLESAAVATEQDLPALKTEIGIRPAPGAATGKSIVPADVGRSEEHTSELQSLMRISYAVFCLEKKKKMT